MVEPIPLHGHPPVLSADRSKHWPEQDAVDRALAEHHETQAAELRGLAS